MQELMLAELLQLFLHKPLFIIIIIIKLNSTLNERIGKIGRRPIPATYRLLFMHI